jgi:type II secretory pathway pseudopilin PulG
MMKTLSASVVMMLAASTMAVPLMQGSLVRSGRNADVQPITVSMNVIADEDGVEVAEQTIQEGVRIEVKFELKQVPICADSVAKTTGCTVRVILENTRPDEVALSKCYVEWNTNDGADAWKEPRIVEITTVEDFVDDGEKVIIIKTLPTESNTEFYTNVDLPDIRIVTPDKGTAECSSTTDPNYRQFDGDNFIINNAGTFKLWGAEGRDWEVQSRVANGFNCGVALRDGCDRVVFDRCSGTFSMRKYFAAGGDPDEQPIISREGGSTWVVTSRKSGAQVKVVQRVKINRVGTQTCGWSGCRISYHTTRKDWLDVHMKAPGSDYGWVDSDTAQKSVPRTTGVCGAWTSDRSDDKFGQGTRNVLSNSGYVNSYTVSGQSLFDATPAQCETVKPPVPVEVKSCSVTPRRIQKPIISVFDIEDITDMLKNTIAGDDDEEEAVYVFDSEEMPEILRSVEFMDEQKAFCEQAMKGTSFAKDCMDTEHRITSPGPTNTVEGANAIQTSQAKINLDAFVDACYHDVLAQAPACAGSATPCSEAEMNDLDVIRDVLAIDTYETLEEHCIDLMAKDDKYAKTCPETSRRAGKCEMHGKQCVGDCELVPAAELAKAVEGKCPNSCGIVNTDNMPEDGSGGKCILDEATQKNVCECFDPTAFGGPDCTIVVGGTRPALSHLTPYGCATQPGKKGCPFDVLVHADESVTSFIKGEDIRCEVNGETTAGTFIDQTRIRCPLAASTHRGSSDVDFHKVRVSQDGQTFSHFLHFCYHNSECTSCENDGSSSVVEGSCAIDGKCFEHDKTGDDEYSKCKVCDTAHSQTNWKFTYTHADCGPTFRSPATIKVGEKHPLHTPINAGSPLTTKLNLYTQGDEVNVPKYYLTEPSDIFQLDEDTGIFRVTQLLDYETKNQYKLGIKVSQGGLHHTDEVTIELFDQDEGAVFTQAPYSATVEENAPVGAVSIITQDGAAGKIEAADPDNKGSEFGTLEFTIDYEGSTVGNFPFQIDPVSGVVSTTEPLNHEERAEWKLIITASSGGGSSSSTHLTVTVSDINEAPTFVSLDTASVKESAVENQKVASVTISDPDVGDSHTVTIEGEDAAWFKVVDGKLLIAKSGLDFESMEDHTLQFTLKATDAAGLFLAETLTLQLTDANDAPEAIHILAAPTEAETPLTELKPLTAFDEAHNVYLPLAVLTVDDQDAVQEHTFEIVAAKSSDKFLIMGGNVLVLQEAVDYEAYIRAGEDPTIRVTLVATDSDDYGTGSLSSTEQTFDLTVLDGIDVPRDFKLTKSDGFTENSGLGHVVGTLEALDQDENDEFELGLSKEQSNFNIGATTCKNVENKGTVCSAELTVAEAIDFESNRRASADESFVYVEAVADSDSTGASDCGMNCPKAMVLDENEAPVGVAIEGVVANGDGSFTVSEGITMLGGLEAVDVDDSCPLDLAGCSDFTPSGAYTFKLAGNSEGRFELPAQCGEELSLMERKFKPCTLQTTAAGALEAETTYEVSIEVTDQGGMTSVLPLMIRVASAEVALSVWTGAGANAKPLESVEENHIMRGDEIVGEIRLSGWVFEGTEPPTPRVTKGPFSVQSKHGHKSTAGRRSRSSSAEISWVLRADNAALKRESENIVIELTLDSTADSEAVVFSKTITITEFVPTKAAATRICEGNDCDWVRPTANDASKWVELSAFAQPGFELLKFDLQEVESRNSQTGITYNIQSESPVYDLYEIIVRQGVAILRTAKKPALVNAANGTIDRSRVTVRSRKMVDGFMEEVEQFTIVVAIDYCPTEHPVCDNFGTFSCQTLNRAPHFECVCEPGFDGADCSIFTNEARFQNQASSNSDDGMASGMIAVIAILVVLCVLLMVAGVAFYRNRNAQSSQEMEAIKVANMILQQEQAAAAAQGGENRPAPFIPGMANRLYDWYDPTASKQEIYEDLAGSNPGDFRVRGGDLRNQNFDLHLKTPQMLIKDHKIEKVADGYKIAGAGNEAQPAFPLLPMLIQYYAEVEDPNAPFVLKGAENPIYFAVDESVDVYDNAAIKGEKNVVANPLALPAKAAVQQDADAPMLPQKGVTARSEC